MNLLELVAKITLDSSEYQSGLSKVGSAMGTMAKVGATAIAGATTAVVAFGASAVSAGKDFDSAMSQVEATMGSNAHKMIEYNGETVDSFVALRDFAQQMGASTAFSATEASEGLNILAMAGFDATQQMEALPGVLALASAGGLDLAQSADYVTGIMAGFGQEISKEGTDKIADMLAVMSSSAKGDVASFGEGLSTVAGMASTTGQKMEDMAVALEILGNNNVSASEGGNALSRTLKNLYQATSTGQEGLDALGVSAYTAEGEARPLQDVLLDLNQALDGMSDEAKNEALSQIFDSATLKSVPFLINGVTNSWDKLSEGVENAKGSAQTMADVQLDNLEGSITLFKSALEGVQIVISDMVTPALKDFVDLGGEGLQQIADALKNGDIDGAFEALGTTLSTFVQKLGDLTQPAIEAGLKLLKSFVKGILDNKDQLMSTAFEIVMELVNAFLENLPEIIQVGLELLVQLAMGIAENLPTLIPTIVDVILQIVDTLVNNVDLLIEASIALILGLTDGLMNALPLLAERVPEIVLKLIEALISNAPKMWNASFKLVISLADGIINYWGTLLSKIPGLVTQVVEKFKAFASNWRQIGTNIVAQIWEGLSERWDKLVEDAKKKASDLVDALKNFFGSSGSTSGGSSGGGGASRGASASSLYSSGYSYGTQSIASSQNVYVTLQGDADRLFRLMQEQSSANVRLTGQPSF